MGLCRKGGPLVSNNNGIVIKFWTYTRLVGIIGNSTTSIVRSGYLQQFAFACFACNKTLFVVIISNELSGECDHPFINFQCSGIQKESTCSRCLILPLHTRDNKGVCNVNSWHSRGSYISTCNKGRPETS